MKEFYENLANAIIVQAFEDYTPACKQIERCKENVTLAQEQLDALLHTEKTVKDALECAKRNLHRHEGMLRSAEANKQSIEAFFTSSWFRTLTKVDGQRLLAEAKKEAAEKLGVVV